MSRVSLNDVAEAITNAQSTEDYIVHHAKKIQLLNQLREAALCGALACYNYYGKYQPKETESNFIIFSTEKAVNKYLEEIESPFRYRVKEAVEDMGEVSHVVAEPNQKTLSKLERQQQIILNAIKTKGFDPKAIPDGGKGTIKSICELENIDDLFNAGTAFDRAWKKGVEELIWRMEYHESYAPRGNN